MIDPGTDQSLDALIYRYLEEVHAGTPHDEVIDALCARHPERAAGLRKGVELLIRTRLHPGPSEDGLPDRIGPFQLIRRLGAGGMGVVYLAKQEQPERHVALKLVRPEVLWFEGYRDRFQREVESAGRLSHPGIAQVHEIGEADGVPWFSQEYIIGAPLDTLLSNLPSRAPETLRGADLRETLADALIDQVPDSGWDDDFFEGSWQTICLQIVRQLAEALQHAHERGVLHRDIKPSNVLLTPRGRVVIVDFGLANVQGADRLTRTGALLGSLHYMPPEQVDGAIDEIGPWSDVYSLGVTLYELLALRAPYASQSVERLRGMILTGEARRLRELNPSVTSDAEVVCATAMDSRRESRYQSASAFAADVSALLGHLPIAARPTGPLRRLARWTRRHPALAVTLVASFLLVVVVPGVFAIQSYFANRRLAEALAEGDALLSATLAGFEGVVLRTAQSTTKNVPWYQEERLELIDRSLAVFREVLDIRPSDRDTRFQDARMRRTRANILRELGRLREAESDYDSAGSALESLLAGEHEDPAHLRELASVLYMQSLCIEEAGRRERSDELLNEALRLQRRATELEPGWAGAHRDLAKMSQKAADILHDRAGPSEEQRAMIEEAVSAARQAAHLTPEDADSLGALYLVLDSYAMRLVEEGRTSEAMEALDEGRGALERAIELAPEDRTLRKHQIDALRERAELALETTRDHETAIPVLEAALDLAEALSAEFPAVAEYRATRLAVLGTLAFANSVAGDKAGGRAALERIAEARMELAESEPDNAQSAGEAAAALANLANIMLFDPSLGEGRYERMLDVCERAGQWLDVYAERHPGRQAAGIEGFITYCIGAAWYHLGDSEELSTAAYELMDIPNAPPKSHHFAAILLDQLTELTGDHRHQELGFRELQRLVESGFRDYGSWRQSEMAREYEDYPGIEELDRIVRERAAGH